MFGRKVRLAALATTATGVLLLAGCSAGDHADAPPPPTPQSEYRAEASAPDLMGAAPPPNASEAQDGLLGGPVAPGGVSSRPLPPPGQDGDLKTWRRPDGTLVTAMKPIPNPHGSRHSAQARPAAQPHGRSSSQSAEVAATGDTRSWRRADGTLVTAMRPVPNPKSAHRTQAAPRVHATIPTHHAAPVARPVAKTAPKPAVAAAKPIQAKPITPKTVAPAPAPLKAAKPILPATPLTKPPVVAAKPPTPAKPTTKLEKLQAAVATDATNGAVLAAGESLSQNQAGQVTLSLPVTLGDMIKAEAAKLGLGKAAKKTSAYAQLSGEGYEVTPNGRQTAVVKPGEPTTFAWQVKPGPEAKGQLKSEFGVELNGAKPPQEFALGTITKRVAALPEKVKKSAGGLNFGALNGDVSLPGLGPTPLKTVLGVLLVLLALAILIGVSRNAAASRRRTERQRKYRTMSDYGRNEMEFEAPQPAQTSYVNPFVAGAAGAAVGAVAATAVAHHNEEKTHEEPVAPAPEPPHAFHPFAPPETYVQETPAPEAHVQEAHVETPAEPHVEHAPSAHVEPAPEEPPHTEPAPYVNPMVAAASAPARHEENHQAREPEPVH